jgi:hypothetical protein
MATETTEQIVRESPDIEAYKLGLLQSAKALPAPVLPGYQVAGMSPEQISAMQRGMEGIGAYQPYLQAGQQNLQAGAAATGEAADLMRGADTRGQFGAAQEAYNLAAQPAAAMGSLANVAGSGMGLLGQGAQGMQEAQQMSAQAAQQPGFQQGIGSLMQGAQQGAAAAGSLGSGPMAQAAGNISGQQMSAPSMQSAQTGFSPNLQSFQMDPAQQVQAQSFGQAGTAESMMSPYMDAVVKAQQREASRQADIAGTQRSAQAVRAGAFGGSRQAIESAEAQRNLATQMGDIQASGLQSAFQQAQGQFNTEQQANHAAQQANQQAGLTVGQQNLASQQSTQQLGTQTGLQTSLANLSNEQQAAVQNQAAQLQASGMNAQQAMQAAMANQGVQQQTNLANQAMQGQYGLQGAQMGMQAAGLTQNVGQAQIGAAGQQGQLGMQAAGQYGQLAGQQAGLAGQYANIAGQQAGILGQQSQLQQQLGQGIGNLAGQQFGIGQQMAQGIGSLGGQLGNLGVQQAALGQTAQGLGQQDVNFQYNLGSQVQRQTQAELDAQRATSLQTALQPTQQLAFLSDIYKGAPSTQMSATTQNQAAPSPFQQIAGLGAGALATAGAAKTAGLF